MSKKKGTGSKSQACLLLPMYTNRGNRMRNRREIFPRSIKPRKT